MTYPNALFSAFAFIGFLLCVIPCPRHLTSWNTGACLYMVWTGLGCLNQFINSVIWNHNVANRLPVWCDISSKLMIGISIGIPTASLCICRRLYLISSLKSFTISKAETRRHIAVDLSIGMGLPVLVMTLHYIVQGHRFNIFEDVGCGPSIYYTWQAYVIVASPPIAIGLISAVYAVLNVKQLFLIDNRIKAVLPDNGITPTMYVRFLGLAIVEIVCTVPLALFFLIWNAKDLNFRFPWISWADTHYNFSRVELYPATVWRGEPSVVHTVELNRWLSVICAFVFFAFFGYTDETKKTYGCIFKALGRRIGLQSTKKINPIAPLQFKSATNHSQFSFDSFTDATASNNDLNNRDPCQVEKQDPDDPISIAIPRVALTTHRPSGAFSENHNAGQVSSTLVSSQASSFAIISAPKAAHIEPTSLAKSSTFNATAPFLDVQIS